ncbi:aldehyde dehydrogenase family protein [Brevibacillus sp. DP1.3A]|uniref:aldehyde dehydrogenase family protein n=1 Tax=Brevibacillus sp. DP1.3A TaxID=2738867 RepID=UPI00156B0B29|nr:aldehyde dehydrogenase family protein [Brevibacillus sp. DP1.3A]UED72375.1 aldehyde dehydrogenase family protein [Brevibacillus sp. DP1.3A]
MSKVLGVPQESVAQFLSDKKQMLINGEWVPSLSGKIYESINPANGEVIAKIYEGDEADVDQAVRAARAAFNGSWSKTSPAERTKFLNKLADLLEQRVEEFAYLETLDGGNTITLTRHGFVPSAVAHLRYYAGWATKLTGQTIPLTSGGNFHAYTRREPLGVCGQITPWNYPLLGTVWKLAAPLAAGNTVILKPSQQTTLTTLLLGELIMEAGFPAGVVNIVTGSGRKIGEAITSHPDIDKIGFTGSTEVGKGIMRKSADTLKKITLELGGKSPNIIFADADLDKAIQGAFMGMFTNQGQICVAGTRLYVEKSVFQQVTEKLVEMAQKMKVGNPLDPATQMGPLISKEHLQSVKNYIEIAQKEGATVLTGGNVIQEGELAGGNYLEPTILTDLEENCTAVKEEIFGPVLCVMPFEQIEEVIERANETEYGLAAGVWTQNLTTAHKVIDALKAGTVWVNTYLKSDNGLPFGGHKQSGIGVEMGNQGIEAYTKTKSVLISLN